MVGLLSYKPVFVGKSAKALVLWTVREWWGRSFYGQRSQFKLPRKSSKL